MSKNPLRIYNRAARHFIHRLVQLWDDYLKFHSNMSHWSSQSSSKDTLHSFQHILNMSIEVIDRRDRNLCFNPVSFYHLCTANVPAENPLSQLISSLTLSLTRKKYEESTILLRRSNCFWAQKRLALGVQYDPNYRHTPCDSDIQLVTRLRPWPSLTLSWIHFEWHFLLCHMRAKELCSTIQAGTLWTFHAINSHIASEDSRSMSTEIISAENLLANSTSSRDLFS